MLAKVEDLRKGDVVLTTCGSVLLEAKLLRQPQLAKLGRKTTWKNTPRWSSVLCAIREESKVYSWGTGPNLRTWTKTEGVIANGREYNREKRIDFTERECWVIKREV